MECAHQQAVLSPQYDVFAAVLGHRRGLDAKASLARDLEDFDVESLLVERTPDHAIARAFFRFRSLSSAKSDLLLEYLGTRMSNTIWMHWQREGVPAALRMLDLGTRERSPWLLTEEHRQTDAGHSRTIHIADLRADAPWVGDDAEDRQLRDLRSLCGADHTQLPGRQARTRRKHHRHFRGTWLTPSTYHARRCLLCKAQVREQGLIIPALAERERNSIRRGRDFTDEHIPLLREHTLELLTAAPSYASVCAAVNAQTRAIILARLVEAISDDPIPILIAVLAVRERAHLTAFRQADLHARLQTLDWKTLLEVALPAKAAEDIEGGTFHNALADATQRLRPKKRTHPSSTHQP
jgi:hypothetical protein